MDGERGGEVLEDLDGVIAGAVLANDEADGDIALNGDYIVELGESGANGLGLVMDGQYDVDGFSHITGSVEDLPRTRGERGGGRCKKEAKRGWLP